MTTALGARWNASGIQMIPQFIKSALFPGIGSAFVKHPRKELLDLSQRHLKMHKISTDLANVPPAKEPKFFQIPPLAAKASNLEAHFKRIGDWLSAPLFEALKGLSFEASAFPREFSLLPGWSTFDPAQKPCGIPTEKILVLDVETNPVSSGFPVLVTAYAPVTRKWYLWISPEVLLSHPASSLCPIGREKILIGHFVSFDRAMLQEEYSSSPSANQFICTMALHSATSGLSSHQRPDYMKNKKVDSIEDNWNKVSSLNSLEECSRLHLGRELDKSPRELLIKASLDEVIKNLPKIAIYCSEDTLAANDLFKVLWPRFLIKCPHSATIAGMLIMGSEMRLPAPRFSTYVESAEKAYKEANAKIHAILEQLVNDRIDESKQLDVNQDPWMSSIDCTIIPEAWTKAKHKKDGSFASGGEPRPKGNQWFWGKPAWTKEAFDSQGTLTLTLGSRLTHILLKLKWNNEPITFNEELHSFVYGPTAPSAKKIPHPTEEGANVGSLITSHFYKAFEAGTLSSPTPHLNLLMQQHISCSFWRSYKERVKDQLVVNDWIIPKVCPMGTVTRRAVERTWMTIGEAKGNIIGSELKSRIQAPPGWRFVGADVDSQELWIASVMGDSQFGWHGASALGWMTLQGCKSSGTDMHSKTAAILGISRGDAKVFNYSRIYGAGQKSTISLLSRKGMGLEEAVKRVADLFAATKGRRRGFGESRLWAGGSESLMFNFLEREATKSDPRTPALGSSLSDALLKENCGTSWMTSRVNWVVQSSGVDYLHLLLVSMKYLAFTYGIEVKFCISIHDEVRFLTPASEWPRTAFALQIANLWTRAFIASRLGMQDLPLGVAFFSSVDVDRILRKEPSYSTKTPSNPQGDVVEPEEAFSLDMNSLLNRVEGLGKPLREISVSLFDSKEIPGRRGPCSASENLCDLQMQISDPESERKGEKGNNLGLDDPQSSESTLQPPNPISLRLFKQLHNEPM